MALDKLVPGMVADAATFFAGIKQASSETATGVVELATTTEASTGTDTARAVTPAGVAAAVASLASYPPPRVLAKTSGTSVDLANVEVVTFSYGSPVTITTFTNVATNKVYTFRNIGSAAVTINRDHAYLNGSANVVLDNLDVVQLIGANSTTLWQASPKSDNG